jgi:hypothetical protein
MKKIKPCPYEHSKKYKNCDPPEVKTDTNGKLFIVICPCGMRSSVAKSPKKAIKLWNKLKPKRSKKK